MGSLAPPELQQIHFGVGPNKYEPVAHYEAKTDAYAQELADIQASLLSMCPLSVWPQGSYRAVCPRPILVSKQHQQQIAELQRALATAITDIVGRWWTDKEANFPKRMPLLKEEEDLLQWIEVQVLRGNLPPYSTCQGSWRPDFLPEEDESNCRGATAEKFRITEINARFSFNGFIHESYGQQALENLGIKASGLASATDGDKLLNRLFSVFNPMLPLHLLIEEEAGLDIHMFIDAVQRRWGVTPRLIRPSDLRLLPDPQSKGDYRLCCLIENSGDIHDLSGSSIFTTDEGEAVEEINQVGLELLQHELLALEPEMLRQVSLRCFNDMRTIFLVHDKRMLAIVKQELQPLVAQGVLTPAQAHILNEGIVDTFLPGSQELDQLLQLSKLSPKLKDSHILKPVRGGKGIGIVFGEDLTADEWVSTLGHLQSPEIVSETTCVIQRRIIPRLYDVILGTSGERVRYPLVGTYHAIGGEFLGLGLWRSSNDRVCAITRGSSWMCSVIDANE
ncbi:hypothetical protein F4781DRAFT_411623 [Annulohypoxylon bovei var. microspora]|nr:hypothetical protein F4781DRAFT_411623 [Annulohypoxylon bovei var. microspora]